MPHSPVDKSNAPQIDAEEILDGILSWTEIESPTADQAAVNRMADKLEADFAAVGLHIERTPGRDGYGDILAARSPWGGEGPGILVLSHFDTVHPVGSAAELNPIRRDGDKVYGPGISDMKGGAYLAYAAYRHLVRLGKEAKLPITFLFLPDEEVGSPTSRETIESHARSNKYVLVTEPARDGGCIVTARKGVADFHIKIIGRPSHAGGQHAAGRSAILEMARQIVKLEAMTDYEAGLTLSVGTIEGGTTVNVRPEHCSAWVDMRVPDMETAEHAVAAVHGLVPFDPDCRIEVTGGLNRPPFTRDGGTAKLFDQAKELAAEIGFELKEVRSGGGSDGNFSAAMGIPTLDGLGVDGGGAHTHHEHMLISSIVPRTRLMLRLFETLE
ncbi:MAG: M20 family metallopeptidase [Alphaproteobacteria bacterium]|nr:M20 family metallopeptidase [Alphaproteobacteria bacterium]